MTRRHHLSRRNIITVLNSNYSRAVDGVVRFLTDEDELEILLSRFEARKEFPKFCQVDFDVVMRTSKNSDPDADQVKVREAYILTGN